MYSNISTENWGGKELEEENMEGSGREGREEKRGRGERSIFVKGAWKRKRTSLALILSLLTTDIHFAYQQRGHDRLVRYVRETSHH